MTSTCRNKLWQKNCDRQEKVRHLQTRLHISTFSACQLQVFRHLKVVLFCQSKAELTCNRRLSLVEIEYSFLIFPHLSLRLPIFLDPAQFWLSRHHHLAKVGCLWHFDPKSHSIWPPRIYCRECRRRRCWPCTFPPCPKCCSWSFCQLRPRRQR